MPRRGRSAPMRPMAPSRPMASRPMSTAPAHPPPAAPAHAPAQPRQPGLFANMAATAGGVAIGSAVGHTIGHAMTGGGGNQPQEQAPAQPEQQQQQQGYNPCQRELQQFLDCAQGQADIALCSGFNEALRQCKVQYGGQQP
ncbi:hypothetical protein V1264_022622 [Littorina saxatilis]|uniref:Coiled-coil-helix-coiled-coil-helix domain-containing protein 2 n=1 Tax=Littorina saxatilis TaxID=31220 RepID=A0AAN9AKQ3_9CAEN